MKKQTKCVGLPETCFLIFVISFFLSETVHQGVAATWKELFPDSKRSVIPQGNGQLVWFYNLACHFKNMAREAEKGKEWGYWIGPPQKTHQTPVTLGRRFQEKGKELCTEKNGEMQHMFLVASYTGITEGVQTVRGTAEGEMQLAHLEAAVVFINGIKADLCAVEDGEIKMQSMCGKPKPPAQVVLLA
uniref:Uncharacterized protein n=1 Tax=Strigamia maritima TaxID=126957 RepID=T1JJ09_STRMM